MAHRSWPTDKYPAGCSKRPSSSSVVRLSYLVVRKRRTSYLARYASRGTLHGIRFFAGGLFQHPARAFKCTKPYDAPQTSDSRREFLLLPNDLLMADPLYSCQEGPGYRSLC